MLDSPELTNELRRERATLAQLEAQLGATRIAAAQQLLAAQREADEAARSHGRPARAAERRARMAQRHDSGAGVPASAGRSQGRDDPAGQRPRRRRAVGRQDRVRPRDRRAAGRAPAPGRRRARASGRRARDSRARRRRRRHARGRGSRRGRGQRAADDRGRSRAGSRSRSRCPRLTPTTSGWAWPSRSAIGASTAAATVSAISPEVVDSRVLARVRFAGEQPAGLRQRQRVSARVLIEERPDVLMLPRGPFLDAHGGRYVYVIDGDRALRRPIRVGAASVDAVEITRRPEARRPHRHRGQRRVRRRRARSGSTEGHEETTMLR